MFKISKKKHLEMAIQEIPSHPNPKVSLEQYSTPATIAADIMWNGYNLGDIKNRSIMDLGCGTGIFSISSILLGANNVIGIDVDGESLEIAKKAAINLGISDNKLNNLIFYQKDINEFDSLSDLEIPYLFNSKVDTLIQNPPFGSQQRTKRGADRKFIEVASKNANVIYSFHMANTENFVKEYFEKLGGIVTHKFLYNFPLKKIYNFHTKDSKDVNVVVFRVEMF